MKTIEVQAKLLKFGKARKWEVTCPYCGQQHRHVAGIKGQDPDFYLMVRIAPCDPDRREYKLVRRAENG